MRDSYTTVKMIRLTQTTSAREFIVLVYVI